MPFYRMSLFVLCCFISACGGGGKSANTNTGPAAAIPYNNISWTKYPAGHSTANYVAVPSPLLPITLANQPTGAFDGYVYDSRTLNGLVGFTAIIPVSNGSQPDAAVSTLLTSLQASLSGSTWTDIDPVTLADTDAAGTLQAIQLPTAKPLRTLLNDVLQSIGKNANTGITNLISNQSGEPNTQSYRLSLGLVHRPSLDVWVLTVAIVDASEYATYADPMFVFTSTSNINP